MKILNLLAISLTLAFTALADVFTYRDDRWQALAGQESPLGEAKR
ncbi:MAG: hypothetical protein WCA13_01780 [Terriglobales bacterium]